jgi:uncharacterized protein YceH (UPF0502 family)
MLDRTEQRIVGVLIEKEATVPDIYPMSENALVDGCNQKNNRDPVMGLEQFQVAGALMALVEKAWVTRVDGHGRVIKYRHRVVDRLALTKPELAVLCELLVRGAQAPGALKARVARLGYTAEPPEIEALLQKMASRPDALVAQLPLAPRERDRRWRHLLGSDDEVPAAVTAPAPAAVPATPPPPPPPVGRPGLEARVAALEAEVAALRAELERLRG